MKKMIKAAMVGLAMFTVVSSVAKGQDAGAPPAQRGGSRAAAQKALLLKDIKIDSATDAKIDAVLQTYSQQQREIMQAARASGGQPDMTKVDALMKKRNAEVRELLREEQRKIFDANAEAAAAAAAARRAGAPRPPASA
jgi:Spy/CpxP family protein refolding chaperone